MKLFQYLTLSIATHLVVWFFLAESRLNLPKNEVIEVTYLKPDEGKSQRFIQEAEVDKLNQALDKLQKKADFLSKTQKRVREQQVVQGSSQMGQNRNSNASKQSQVLPPPQVRQNSFDPPPLNGDGPSMKKQTRQTDNLAPVQLGASVLREFLPEVKSGNFTSLNTDQFLFYTFYARINEQIRNRWVENIRAYTERVGPVKTDQLSRSPQRTQVEILLKPNGDFYDVRYHNRSQDNDLDEAAALAFVRAQPFVNPPEEIVQEDGFIHLHYMFEVYFRPNAFVRGNK